MKVSTGALGLPRMGPKRELKFCLEKYWRGDVNKENLLTVANKIEEDGWTLQKKATIEHITVGDYYLYDGMLQWANMLGIVPQRFHFLNQEEPLKRLFAMARGINEAPALSMKKWITSNYHYMVPEFDGTAKLVGQNFDYFFESLQRGQSFLGKDCATPVVLGPVTIARLTKTKSVDEMKELLDLLIPIYNVLIDKIVSMGFTEIQVHEPVLVFAEDDLLPLFKRTYPAIISAAVEKNVNINMVTYMEDIGEGNYLWLIAQPEIRTISLDFSAARGGHNIDFVTKHGFPTDKILGAGIIDARNVWKAIPSEVVPILTTLKSSKIENIRIQPSSSLQYCPWDFALEESPEMKNHPAAGVLAFAAQKLDEISLIAKAVANPALLTAHTDAWNLFTESRKKALSKSAIAALERLRSITEKDLARDEPYKVRRNKQLPGLPLLPTTTIGSFPQTNEIRRLRAQWKKGAISDEEYNAGIDQQIAFCIGIQEALGLDVFVHGEAERTDMVEYFGQQMEGMLFTSHGWVQSFGSRCVRPPIIWNDVSRPTPMTVREYVVAQKLTSKPVKGMLTGPVTILNWSFPRADISRKEQAYQIGLCVRDEIHDLEVAGCQVVQVDEPALREGMPLRTDAKDEYLLWAVDSFRLATAGAKNETQIQTHMCYCEFKDCMDAIDRMDTDVNSIENSRSDNATLEAFRSFGYDKGFGPGTYDIHSPIIPSISHQVEKIESFLTVLDPTELVINPDCGLKTRTWPETIAALRNMVIATEKTRASRGLSIPVK